MHRYHVCTGMRAQQGWDAGQRFASGSFRVYEDQTDMEHWLLTWNKPWQVSYVQYPHTWPDMCRGRGAIWSICQPGFIFVMEESWNKAEFQLTGENPMSPDLFSAPHHPPSILSFLTRRTGRLFGLAAVAKFNLFEALAMFNPFGEARWGNQSVGQNKNKNKIK